MRTAGYCRRSVSARSVPALRLIMRPPPAVFARTVILGNNLRAFVAFDRAAPVELAVTAADHLNTLLHHSMTAFIAQPAAALPLPLRQVLAALQTLPPLRAVKFQALVLDAVIRGILQVNELCLGDAPERVRKGSSVVGTVASPRRLLVHLQLLCVFVLNFQVVAHLSEVGQLHPAGLDAAAAGNPVTLTGSPHCSFDCLPREGAC